MLLALNRLLSVSRSTYTWIMTKRSNEASIDNLANIQIDHNWIWNSPDLTLTSKPVSRKITSHPFFPSPLSLFGHSPLPYRGIGPGPLCCNFWSTLFESFARWLGHIVSVLKRSLLKKTKKKQKQNKNKKKPCRSAKTKLTYDLWYQARSKAEINAASKLA